jgi:hypothetical protein
MPGRTHPSAHHRGVQAVLHVGVTVTLLMAAAPGAASQTTSPAPEDRVRLVAPGVVDGRLTGTVVTISADALAIRDGDGTVRSVPRSSITRLEVSRGRSRAAGALKGGLWGTGAGLALALANTGFSDGGCDENAGECVGTFAGIVSWTALGTGLGTLVGFGIGSERWQRLPVGVSFLPRGRPGLGLSLPWQ